MTKFTADLTLQIEESGKRAAIAAQQAAENEAWARKSEQLLALAVKREREANGLALQARHRAEQSARLVTELEKIRADLTAAVASEAKMKEEALAAVRDEAKLRESAETWARTEAARAGQYESLLRETEKQRDEANAWAREELRLKEEAQVWAREEQRLKEEAQAWAGEEQRLKNQLFALLRDTEKQRDDAQAWAREERRVTEEIRAAYVALEQKYGVLLAARDVGSPAAAADSTPPAPSTSLSEKQLDE